MNENKNNFTPDPKKHLVISVIKSILRIIAGTSLVFGSLFVCGTFIVLAELLGILEELV